MIKTNKWSLIEVDGAKLHYIIVELSFFFAYCTVEPQTFVHFSPWLSCILFTSFEVFELMDL